MQFFYDIPSDLIRSNYNDLGILIPWCKYTNNYCINSYKDMESFCQSNKSFAVLCSSLLFTFWTQS